MTADLPSTNNDL